MTDSYILQTLLETTNDAVLITDGKKRILRVNQTLEEVTGFGIGDLIGKHPQFLAAERNESIFKTSIERALGKRGAWEGELWCRRKDMELHLMSLLFS